MAQQNKNVVVVHLDAEVIDCDEVSVVELLSQVLDVDDFVLSFHNLELLLDFFNIGFVCGLF